MRSLSVRALLSLFVLILTPAAFAHDITLTGTQSFASLDGSSADHDGVTNGVFTVSDGNLTVNGTVNCNDGIGFPVSPCPMVFSVSGNMTVNAGGALYAEDRIATGSPASITLNVGGNLVLGGSAGSTPGAIVSTAALVASIASGGNVTANVTGSITMGSGATIDASSFQANAGNITLNAGALVSIDGNVLSGPSRTFTGTLTGTILSGAVVLQKGGQIAIKSTTFAEPALIIGGNAAIVSQGENPGAGPVTLDACGIEIRGLVASMGRNATTTKVIVRSGQDILIDARDLGVAGATLGRKARLRADSTFLGTAENRAVEVFARGSVSILGPAAASSTRYSLSSNAGAVSPNTKGGTVRVIALEGTVVGSGRIADVGHDFVGGQGGLVNLAGKGNVDLTTGVIRAIGNFTIPSPGRKGGAIAARSYSGNVVWVNGTGDVRPTGSTSGIPPADQGTISLTACGTITTTGSSFPTNGSPTGAFPTTTTGVCSPAAPSLPAGVVLITCNTPPVANDVSATTNEDTTVTITLSGTDVDGDPLTFSIVSGPSNGVLGPIVPTGPNTATVNYSPNLNFNGSDSFIYQANDGNGGTDNATVSITVVAVNDPPSFLAGPTVIVLEDSGPQTYPNWATSISAGPPDESGQTVTFTVNNDNASLFSVQPAVASNGTLTFTPAANAYGSANITVTAQDNGGIANGGNDTSAPQTSSITVTPVNDEPSFTGGGDVSVFEDSGPYSAAWASAISAGPNEGGQTVTFNVSNDNNALFSVQPAVSSSGVLTFTPAANANGSAIVTVSAQDDGGTANGGDDTSPSQTFTITVGAVNDAPSFTSGGDVTVLEDSGAYSAAWATGISAGPADEAGQTVAFSVSNDNNALFSVQPAISPSGVLTFTLTADTFGSATVTVTLSDNGGILNGGVDTSAPQTFTIIVNAVNDEPSFTPGGDVTVLEDSGSYSAAWATAISAGPNEGGQTLTFNVSNDNNGLFSTQPAVDASGNLTFTLAADAFGSATVSVFLMDDGGIANGGDDTSPTVTFTITVDPVNDAPSFTSGGDVTVLEDSSPYSASWATSISAGPANESSQNVSFVITANSNPSLFTSGPSVAADGTLSFTLAANAFGSASITLHAQDDGGTTNGGDDTSASVTFTITVDPVNDAPSFTAGGDVTVNEDSGAYSAAWASAISAGPNESGQTVSFNVSNNNNALFSAQPSISPTGVLMFTPAANAFGTATVTVSLSDNGGIANGGVDTSAAVTFTITVNSVNDPPTAGADAWTTVGNTELRVDFGPAGTPHVLATTGSGTGVLHNDADPVEGDPVTITGVVGCVDATAPFDCTFAGGSVLSLNANGSFTFTPGPGVAGGSFQYTISDGTDTATGTVTITTLEMVWYVNGSAAAGGNGTSIAPFNSLTPVDGPSGSGDVDAPGAYIFVHNSTVNGKIGMEANQHLIGEGVGLTIGPFPLVAAGPYPQIVSGANDTVSVFGVTGVEIAGVSVNSTSGEGIEVLSGTLANASVNIHDVIVRGGPNGIRIDGSGGGTLHVLGLSNVTVSGSTPGDGIRVTAATFDAVAGGSFNTVSGGTIAVGASGSPVGGAGVVFSNVSGDYAIGSLSVFGGTSGVTVTGSALYTGAAGMRLTTGGGAISAPAGIGLSVTTATIGAAGLNFTSISSTNTVNGIVLNNTGTSGGLAVSGTGSAGSGGTIQSATGDGILLTTTEKLSLSWMNITGNLGAGIRGTSVNGFVLNNCTVSGNGNQLAPDESGIEMVNLTGTSIGGARPTAINNSTISNNYEFEVQITNNSGTLADFQINNSNISSNGATGVHGNLVNFLGSGTADMTLNVSGGSFTGAAPATATAIQADTAGGTLTANVTGATFINNNVAVNVSKALSSSLTFDIHDNPSITGTRSHALNFFISANSTGAANGKFRNNVIGTLGSSGSGSSVGFGVRIQNEASASTNVLVSGNTIQELAGFAAVNVNHGIVGFPGAGTTAVTVLNNVVRNVNARAIIVQHNIGSGTICADISGNDMSGIAGQAGDGTKIRLRQLAGGTFNVRQNQATAAADPTELDDANSVGANITTAAQISTAGTINYNAGACPQP